jgi:hypothetical protein
VATEKYGVFAKCFCSEIPVPGLLETLYCLFFVLKCTNISKVADTIYQKLSLYLAYPLSVSGFDLYDSISWYQQPNSITTPAGHTDNTTINLESGSHC